MKLCFIIIIIIIIIVIVRGFVFWSESTRIILLDLWSKQRTHGVLLLQCSDHSHQTDYSSQWGEAGAASERERGGGEEKKRWGEACH